VCQNTIKLESNPYAALCKEDTAASNIAVVIVCISNSVLRYKIVIEQPNM